MDIADTRFFRNLNGGAIAMDARPGRHIVALVLHVKYLDEPPEVGEARGLATYVHGTGTSYEKRGFTVGTKLGTCDGSICLETFLARFYHCAKYLKWNDDDKLFQLSASLSGPANQILWDARTQSTVDEVVKLLHNRFGNINQAERFRAELRYRKWKSGENL